MNNSRRNSNTNKRHWLDHAIGQCDDVEEVMEVISSNLIIREVVKRALLMKKALQNRNGHEINPMCVVGTELRSALSNIEPPLY